MEFYIILLLFSCHICFSFASRAMPPSSPSSSKFRTVNLGGWLVTEGWIKPSLFDGIPNKDLLDGTQLQFKSVTQNKYLCAESGGGTIIVANRTSASGWETFKLWRVTENTFQFRVFNNQFVGLSNQGEAIAVANSPSQLETFEIFRNTNDLNRIRIKAPNGLFLQAKSDVLVTADYQDDTTWGDDDPSVFLITSPGRMQGEFQITNGYGTEKAAPIMREHWNTFIVEEDFKFISENGLNGVRIPVGWWITSDPTPPWPFVGGSLNALDNAFLWAEKYDLGVIIDLHAAPGSQNGNEHSASRDGSQEWGKTDENIDQTVEVIDFLAKRYAESSSLLAIELMNEPLAPGVTLDSLIKYYQAGYNTVRKYSSDTYVIMSNRLSASSTELLHFASGLKGSVIDVHYYNLFSDDFNGMTVQHNIDFVNTNRAADLNVVTSSNGPPVFVGEWVAEWKMQDATKEDYQRLAQAMLDVFGRATFGWSYWTLKNVQNHWSLEWMITNGYICFASRAMPPSSPSSSKFRTVNLGGWLVTEGWIKPSLFDGIPNKDLLDGTQLQFKSVSQNKYLCAESGGGTIIVANRTSASGWETFKLWRVTENTFQFRVFNNQFVGLSNQGEAIAVANSPSQLETFEIFRNTIDLNRIRIKAPNGLFLQAKSDVLVTADYQEDTTWGDDDPSVFLITSVGRMQGEFQITNGYGTEKAAPIMREHWNTFIVEEDFKFISQNGLNGVRIPVGWWIASGPIPPWPFVGGSLNALDDAFLWAEKYDLGVIIDLHAAPGSQNGNEHSASRDGSQEWCKTDENIDQTVEVIDFLAKRYAKSSSLLAIELMNEPLAPGVTLDSLIKYYQAGYNTVRKYSSDTYVIMSNRLSASSTELLQFASGLKGSVIDVHYYNLFSDGFNGMTVQQNIDFVNTNRAADLNSVTSSNGPPVFVGEWVAEWKVQDATKEDYQKLAQAMLDVFGRATFGWSYWTLKNVQNHWSLEWMITNGYIKIAP